MTSVERAATRRDEPDRRATVSFNPGPSELLPGVAEDVAEIAASDLLSASHRGEAVHRTVREAREGVVRLLELPDDFVVLFGASATDLMEATVRNLSRRRTLHVCFGAFSRRFRSIAAALGREVEEIAAPDGEVVDLERLAASRTPPPELLTLTHVETSTGAELDLEPLAEWRRRRPDSLVAIDVVSSVPTRRMDWSHGDAWIFSVQKGFGLPAGLGVVVLSPAALERSRRVAQAGADVGWLRRFTAAADAAARDETIETPNVLGLALLGRACLRLGQRGGLAALERETLEKARALHDWLDRHHRLSSFVADPVARARTVAAVVAPDGVEATTLRDAVARRGFVLGSGYGSHRSTQVRIASFPAHSADDLARLRAAIDDALAAR